MRQDIIHVNKIKNSCIIYWKRPEWNSKGKSEWRLYGMWMKKGVKIAIIALVFLAVFAMGGFILNVLIGKPSSNEMLAYMEKVYGKDFEIIEEFTYISYTDGEPEFQRELECPAVVLQDKENSEIRCFVYAYPFETGDWTYQNNYSKKVLLYCIQQEKLMIKNEDACSPVTSSAYPCLVLENTEETAEKLQNLVMRFHESYQYDDKYLINGGTESFGVEGSLLLYTIRAGNTSYEETGGFRYDTPIEEYKAFLEELEAENSAAGGEEQTK